MKFKSKETKYL